MPEREEHGKSSAGTERMNWAELEAVCFYIPEREFLRVRAPFERDAGLLPYGAVSAIAAGEIASTDRFLTTVGMPQGAGDAIRLLLSRAATRRALGELAGSIREAPLHSRFTGSRLVREYGVA